MAFDRNRSRKRRKVCVFCVDKIQTIDYKDTNKLRRYISERGKILPRRTTGTCAMHQAGPSGRSAALCAGLNHSAKACPFSNGQAFSFCLAQHRVCAAGHVLPAAVHPLL